MSADNINNKLQNDTGLRVEIDRSRLRQTPKTDFGTVMATGLRRTADTARTAASIAAPFVPGGAVVSAAITGAGAMKRSIGGVSSSSQALTGNALAGGNATGLTMDGAAVGGGGAYGAVNNLAAAGDPNAQMFNATRQLQELNQSFNLQYLTLQQKMQADNRQFTALSNIMKTKHDTAKNAISNVR